MKKIDISDFIVSLKEEIENFEYYQLSYSSTSKKTYSEWIDSFLKFSGISEDSIESSEEEEEYESELYFGEDSQYEDLVNRRKYRSFRDDDRY